MNKTMKHRAVGFAIQNNALEGSFTEPSVIEIFEQWAKGKRTWQQVEQEIDKIVKTSLTKPH